MGFQCPGTAEHVSSLVTEFKTPAPSHWACLRAPKPTTGWVFPVIKPFIISHQGHHESEMVLPLKKFHGLQPDLFRHRALDRSGGTRRGLGLGLHCRLGRSSGDPYLGIVSLGLLECGGGRTRSVKAWGKRVFTCELASRPSQVCPVLGGLTFRMSVL